MELINGTAPKSTYLPSQAERWPEAPNEPRGQMISSRQFTGGHVTQGSGHHFKRVPDPAAYAMPELAASGNIQVIDKVVERIVEVIRPVPVQKVVERLVERLQVVERPTVRDVPQVQTRVIIENVDKQVFVDKEVYKEMVQEVIIDKVVERIVEKIREVPVDKIVERRVEVIEEVPVVRYVDRIITKEVPVIQVVDRIVEILKEKPVETIKEVPVYVKVEVGEAETRTRGSVASEFSSQQVFYERQATQSTQSTQQVYYERPTTINVNTHPSSSSAVARDLC